MMQADEIWIDGTICTMDPATPHAQAFAVHGGKIIAVGATRDVQNLAGPGTRTHNLGGRFVMPGLIESHIHALWGACRNLFDIYVGFSAGLSDLLEAVAETCRHKDPAFVVFGGPWRAEMRQEMGSRPCELLDAISTQHAIVLHDASQHLLWCNSRALALAGIGRETPDIAGGVIERDPATGAPNGILAEAATAPARALVKRTDAQLAEAIGEATRYLNSMGFTGFKEPMAYEEELRTYHSADQRGDLTLHTAAHITHSSPLGAGNIPYETMDRLRSTYSRENLHLGFAKLFLDGVAPGFTASFTDPYLPDSGYDADAHDPDATLLIPAAELNEMLIQLDRRAYTVKMHAVGDNAIRKGLDAIAAARCANGYSGLRHEIAHSAFVADMDLPRFHQLNAIAEVSPKLWYPNPATPVQTALLGFNRSQKIHRIADLLAAKATVIYGSDWPAAAPDADPWSGLSGMLTRQNPDTAYPGMLAPDQAISLDEALPIFTVNGAQSLGLANETGSITMGKWADFVILAQNLQKTPAPEIAQIRPQATYWKGQLVHSKAA